MSCITEVVESARRCLQHYFYLDREYTINVSRGVAHMSILICGKQLILTLRFHCTKDYAVVLRRKCENKCKELIRWDNAHHYDHVHDYIRHCGKAKPWEYTPENNVEGFFQKVAKYIMCISEEICKDTICQDP